MLVNCIAQLGWDKTDQPVTPSSNSKIQNGRHPKYNID